MRVVGYPNILLFLRREKPRTATSRTATRIAIRRWERIIRYFDEYGYPYDGGFDGLVRLGYVAVEGYGPVLEVYSTPFEYPRVPDFLVFRGCGRLLAINARRFRNVYVRVLRLVARSAEVEIPDEYYYIICEHDYREEPWHGEDGRSEDKDSNQDGQSRQNS